MTEGAALVDAMSEPDLARCLDYAVNRIAATAINLGRCAPAEVYAERAASVAQATGQGNVLSTSFWVGIVRIYRGRLPEAAEVLDAAIEAARLTGYDEGLARMLTVRAMCATAARDIEAALAFAEESVELLRGHDVSWPWMLANWGLAGALLEAGEHARAADLLVEVYGGEDAPLSPPRGRPELFERLAHAQVACGRHEAAARTVVRARESADELQLPLFTATADCTAATVALKTGDPVTAAELALRAAEASEEIGAVLHAARARFIAGCALAATGETEHAASVLTQAATTYGLCGAIGRRDEAERELRKLGRRGLHRRTQPGERDGDAVASLTQRELEVAHLIVDRRTNAEIAATLFLSQKTVESHVRNLFHKLGVSSRAEVARTVERAERRLSVSGS